MPISILRLMSFTVSAVFAIYEPARILGAARLDLFFDDLAYLMDHLQGASAEFIAEIDLHVNPVLAVVNEASPDDGLEVLFHQKSIGGKLVFMVQVNASIMREAKLVVHRYKLTFGLHQIVQNTPQAESAALQGYPEHFLRLVKLGIIKEGAYAILPTIVKGCQNLFDENSYSDMAIAIMAAIARHHGPRTSNLQPFSLIPEASAS